MLKLPFVNSGRIAYNSDIDSVIMNDVLRKSDENDRYIIGLINVIMDRDELWASILTYNKYDVVKFTDSSGATKHYMSLIDDNINYEPTNTTKWWEVTNALPSSDVILTRPTIQTEKTNVDLNDVITLRIFGVDSNASEIEWTITGASYSIVEGTINGTLVKILRIKAIQEGNIEIKARCLVNKPGFKSSDYSNILFIKVTKQVTFVEKDTSLYSSQNWKGVFYSEGSQKTYLSYDETDNRKNQLEYMYIDTEGVLATITFDKAYLNAEFVVTSNGFDYIGKFQLGTSSQSRIKLLKRGVNVQGKKKPADTYSPYDKDWTSGALDNQGYANGVFYTEPSNSLKVKFDIKNWDNSVPAEIMFFKADDTIGKFDFAGEYTGDVFVVETLDGTKQWVGNFTIAEDYFSPIELRKTRG